MESLLMPLIAFALGAIHAFDVDHIAAVTTFVSKNPSSGNASLFGLKWGLGHTLSLLFTGAALLALKLTLPEVFVSSMEFIVGAVLVALGVWIIKGLVQKKIHWHTHKHSNYVHTHFHPHKNNKTHKHSHSVTLVGALHGLAGTASVLVLIPITLLASTQLAILYIAIFGLGSILSMAAYAFILSKFFRLILTNSESIYHKTRGLVGAFSIGLGVYFIIGVI